MERGIGIEVEKNTGLETSKAEENFVLAPENSRLLTAHLFVV